MTKTTDAEAPPSLLASEFSAWLDRLEAAGMAAAANGTDLAAIDHLASTFREGRPYHRWLDDESQPHVELRELMRPGNAVLAAVEDVIERLNEQHNRPLRLVR